MFNGSVFDKLRFLQQMKYLLVASLFVLTAGGFSNQRSEIERLQKNETLLQQMSAEELYELKQRKAKFEGLSVETQHRLRSLQSQLANHPERDRLTQTLKQYHLWLEELSGAEKARLDDLPEDVKITKIKAAVQQQMIGDFDMFAWKRLPAGDVPRLEQWLQEFIERRRGDILDIAKTKIRSNQSSTKITPNNAIRLAKLAMLTMADEDQKQVFDDEEFRSLSQSLSTQSRDILRRAKARGNLTGLLRSWLTTLFQQVQPSYSLDEIQLFFETHLSLRQQALLDRMPLSKRHFILVRLYRFFKLSGTAVPKNWDPRKAL